MDVIYCAGGNIRLANIAIEEGFLYGARSDDVRSLRCNGLIDVKWDNYNWQRHIELTATHRPKYAVAPDIMVMRQVPRALRLAERLAKYCHKVIVVPKIHGIIKYIPTEYVIGVSVPSSYSGFLPDIEELSGREVHLLGGTPRLQRMLWLCYHLKDIIVTSCDSNSHSKASDFGCYWDGDRWCDKERLWIGKYGAFRKSCRGIISMWKKLGAL